MGIDCGSEYTGFGVVEQRGIDHGESQSGAARVAELYCLAKGAIRLSTSEPLEVRLHRIFQELSRLIAEHRPEVVAIEDVFHAANAKSALRLGHVRGVAMLAAAEAGLPVVTYAPLAVKSAVVGYGRAEKAQVQMMVARLLKLDALPQPPDAADALAIAICHAHTAATLSRQAAPPATLAGATVALLGSRKRKS
jgi:crossover junction endodeoxyribonuclease RuvC